MEILKIGDDAGAIQSQQGRPMGRFAGHNVVCDPFGEPRLPLRIDVTALDRRSALSAAKRAGLGERI